MEFSESAGVVKLIVMSVVITVGGIMDGSWKGAAAWAILVGFVWFLWAFMHHEPGKETPQIARKERDRELTGPAIRGRKNPDPTRPTTDDYMGMGVEIFNRKRGM